MDEPKNWHSDTQNNIKLASFDISLTNPPFGKDIKITGKSKLEQFELAHKTDKSGNTKLVDQGEPSTLFLERNLQLLNDGGVLAIILPETYFHAPSKANIRQFIYNHNIQWIIDLPHNTFRPHNNAKCIAIVIQKNTKQQKYINMAVAEYIGHDHNGNAIYKKDADGKNTEEVLDDTTAIIQEIIARRTNQDYDYKYTFQVLSDTVKKADILVPRYYWKSKQQEIEDEANKLGLDLVSLQTLVDEGVLKWFDGNGSPSSEDKGTGNIPYIRVKDIVNWAMYKDPTAFINDRAYNELYKAEKQLSPKDVLYVRRGSYRIGSVAMVSPYDLKVILTREILVLRLADGDNKYGLTPEYLLYALSHRIVGEQAENKIFIDTTLPNIADRWMELKIPIPRDTQQYEELKKEANKIIHSQWDSLSGLSYLREKHDVYMT